MIWAGITYAQAIHLLGGLFVVTGVLTAIGLLLYRVSQKMDMDRRAGGVNPPVVPGERGV